eukprot:NODE_29_length_37665_cov_1.081563.p28 type:complete len:123 gc:universal NODE_29_length_37665_cov_1.081563:25792-25424(-)
MAPTIIKIDDPPVYRAGYTRKENSILDTEGEDFSTMHGLIAKYTSSKESQLKKKKTVENDLKHLNYFVPNRQKHSLRITMGIRKKKKENGQIEKKVKPRRAQQEKTDIKVSRELIKSVKKLL